MEPIEQEYRDWLDDGHSERVAAFAVYMVHTELAPAWLLAHDGTVTS